MCIAELKMHINIIYPLKNEKHILKRGQLHLRCFLLKTFLVFIKDMSASKKSYTQESFLFKDISCI